jgi:YnbE-like lipoprotein
MKSKFGMAVASIALGVAAVAGCTPRVAIEAPKEPITINMNIKIEHEIRVKVDKDLDKVFADKEDIF